MLKNSSIYITTSFITIILNFITLPLYTRHLSLADYGIVGLFIIIGVAVINLLSFGLSQAVQRYYFNNSKSSFVSINSSVIFFLLIIFTLSFFIFYQISDLISKSIFNNEISNSLLNLSYLSGIIIYFYEHNKNLLIAKKEPYKVAFLVIAQLLINFTVSIFCLLVLDLTYLSLIYGLMIANSIVLIISTILTSKHIRIVLSLSKIKKCLLYSFPESPNLVIGLLHNTFDRSMLTNIHGATSLGYYEFSYRFATIFNVVMDSIQNSWNPYFMEKAEVGGQRSYDEINKNLYQLFIIFGFFALGVSYFSTEALYILTTKEFYVAKYYIPLLVILYYISSFNCLSLRQIYFSGRLIYNIPVTIIGIILNISLNILFIPKYGVTGAIFATLIASFASSMAQTYFGYKVFNIRTNYAKLFFIFIFTSLIIILIYPIMYYFENDIIIFFIKIMLIVFYIFFFYFIKLINLKEIINEFRSFSKV